MKKHTESLVRRPLIRILVVWIISGLGFLLADWLIASVQLDGLATGFVVAATVGLLNALLWPLLSRLLLPFAIFTGGLLFLFLNGFIVLLAARFISGFEVNGLWPATKLSIGVTAVNIILSTLLTIDDDAPYYRNVIRRRMRRSKQFVETDVPGVLFLEIDGLARPVLETAMAAGYTPTMQRWLEEGSHALLEWETDLSSQTSASQAGLLHGNNHNIPAFRWYDRERSKIVASSNPDEVARLEKEISNGRGLLFRDGASRGNLLSGDAPNVMNTASTLKDLSRFHTGDYYAYFASPYNFTRTLLLFLWDIVLERYRLRQQQRQEVTPRLDRHHRNFKYALIRGATTVFLRELNIYTLIGDMLAGVPSAYATFVGYDEVAHHSGVETHDAFDALYKIDQQFARLERALSLAPRPYHFVILSDHGQSSGATFQQRYGKTLAGFVQELTRQYRVQGFQESNEGAGNLNSLLNDAIQNEKSATARRAARTVQHYALEEDVLEAPGEQEVLSVDQIKGDNLPDIVVMASGNLGLIYGTRRDVRATLEEIGLIYPGLLEGLVSHEGIGFVMVRSEEHGPVVIGASGRHYLAQDRVEGEDPLMGFGPHAAQHLLREDSFPHCPDILVNSFFNSRTNEVAAFEELIGCHGGLGGYQTQPFLLHPVELAVDGEGPLVGAAAVHHLMKRWVPGRDGEEVDTGRTVEERNLRASGE
jgi:uncharacterized membrane protein YvlD (DUF360 family)